MTNLLADITALPYEIGADFGSRLGGLNRFRSQAELHRSLAQVEQRILASASNLLDLATTTGEEDFLAEARECMRVYSRIQTEFKH